MNDVNVKGKEFGIYVRKKLIELDIQLQEVAESVNIGRTYLYDILSDNRKAYEKRKEIVEFLEQEQEKRGAYR